MIWVFGVSFIDSPSAPAQAAQIGAAMQQHYFTAIGPRNNFDTQLPLLWQFPYFCEFPFPRQRRARMAKWSRRSSAFGGVNGQA
jgi:hypothetical protein